MIFFLPLFLSAQNAPSAVVHADTSSAYSDSDHSTFIDTAAIYRSAHSAFYNSAITGGDKPKWYDIEQQRKHKNDAGIFFILLLLLIILTVLKLAFHATLKRSSSHRHCCIIGSRYLAEKYMTEIGKRRHFEAIVSGC